MATIYSKEILTNNHAAIDKTLILGRREALIYPTPYKTWKTLRVGFFYSFVVDGTQNTTVPRGPGYDIDPILGVGDRIYIGMKRNNPSFPGENNEPFIGIWESGESSNLYKNEVNSLYLGDGYRYTFNYGTLLENGTFTQGVLNRFAQLRLTRHYAAEMQDYAGFYGFVLTVLDEGTATQRIKIQHPSTSYEVATSTSDESLVDYMTTTTYTDVGTYEYSVSGVPCELPDSIFLYMPFPQVNLRIHNIGVIKGA